MFYIEITIILFILSIVASIIKGKSKKETPPSGQPKPFMANDDRQMDPVKKLKQMSKEMYREIQKEFNQELEEPPSRQLPTTRRTVETPRSQPKVQPALTITDSRVSHNKPRESHRGRLSTHGGRIDPIIATQHLNHDFIPRNQQDLVKGIVFSEILGAPKAKR